MNSSIQQIEKEINGLLRGLSERGISIDVEKLDSYLKETQSELLNLKDAILKESNGLITNPNFPDQIYNYLTFVGYTGNRRPLSTLLKYLRTSYPIANTILSYRRSRQAVEYFKSVARRMERGKVYPMYSINRKVSNNIRMQNPNLDSKFDKSLSLVVPNEGKKFVKIDMRDLDVYTIALLTKDPYIIESLKEQGTHKKLASLALDKPYESVTDFDLRMLQLFMVNNFLVSVDLKSRYRDDPEGYSEAVYLFDILKERLYRLIDVKNDLINSALANGQVNGYFGTSVKFEDLKRRDVFGNASHLAYKAFMLTRSELIHTVLARLRTLAPKGLAIALIAYYDIFLEVDRDTADEVLSDALSTICEISIDTVGSVKLPFEIL